MKVARKLDLSEEIFQAAQKHFPQSGESFGILREKVGEREIKSISCVPDANGQWWLEAELKSGERVGAILR